MLKVGKAAVAQTIGVQVDSRGIKQRSSETGTPAQSGTSPREAAPGQPQISGEVEDSEEASPGDAEQEDGSLRSDSETQMRRA